MNLVSNITQKLLVATVLLSIFAYTMIALGGISRADGNHSPDNCIGRLNENTIISSISGSEDSAEYISKSPKVVSGVCIKSGSGSFGDLQHSVMITADGTYENCYKVTGVGTAKVSVDRIANSNSCKGISHIDIRISDKVASVLGEDKKQITPVISVTSVLATTTKPQVIAPVGGVAAGAGTVNLSLTGLITSVVLIVAGAKLYRAKFNS